MDSEDPEARIRDLERQLADRAKTTELTSPGTQYYPPPPPASSPPPPMPPPVGFGAPYPVPSRRPRSGVRGGQLLMAGVLLFVGVSLATSIASVGGLYSGLRSVFDSSSDRPTVAPVPYNRKPPAPAAPAVAATGGQVSVAGVGEDRTIICFDGSVSVSGVSNKVQITGHCAKVTVSGMHNIVVVASAGAIEASGLENRVTFRTGEPQVNNSGVSNVVEQG